MEYKDKFVGFVDILGFKTLVEASESGGGMPLSNLLALAGKLGARGGGEVRAGRGICPQSASIAPDLDFRVTQISDCVVVSAEVSPSGVIHLIEHCWDAVFELLQEGVMCRGYVTRGRIFHTNDQVIGSGYQRAVDKEKTVAVFRHEADERGTPYVEVDRSVMAYIEQSDPCVREMSSRMIRSDGEMNALFPFKRLAHQFIIAGWGIPFDAERERRSNDNIRRMLQRTRERVLSMVHGAGEKAAQKAGHYVAALDAQLAICDKTDAFIATLAAPFPKPQP